MVFWRSKSKKKLTKSKKTATGKKEATQSKGKESLSGSSSYSSSSNSSSSSSSSSQTSDSSSRSDSSDSPKHRQRYQLRAAPSSTSAPTKEVRSSYQRAQDYMTLQPMNDPAQAHESTNLLIQAFATSEFLQNRAFGLNIAQAIEDRKITSSPSSTIQTILDLDYANLAPGKSVLSPAAYLFDMLRIIESQLDISATVPAGYSENSPPAQYTFFARRPDLLDIPLDNIDALAQEMPTLEIVNYVLCRQLLQFQDGYPHDDSTDGTSLYASTGYNDSAVDYQTIANRYEQIIFGLMEHYDPSNNPQTSGSYSMPNAVFGYGPFNWPFDLNFTATEAYFQALGTSAYDFFSQAYALFPHNSDLTLSSLYLGISGLSFNQLAGASESGTLPSQNGSTLSVDTFLQASKISYERLGELLHVGSSIRTNQTTLAQSYVNALSFSASAQSSTPANNHPNQPTAVEATSAIFVNSGDRSLDPVSFSLPTGSATDEQINNLSQSRQVNLGKMNFLADKLGYDGAEMELVLYLLSITFSGDATDQNNLEQLSQFKQCQVALNCPVTTLVNMLLSFNDEPEPTPPLFAKVISTICQNYAPNDSWEIHVFFLNFYWQSVANMENALNDMQVFLSKIAPNDDVSSMPGYQELLSHLKPSSSSPDGRKKSMIYLSYYANAVFSFMAQCSGLSIADISALTQIQQITQLGSYEIVQMLYTLGQLCAAFDCDLKSLAQMYCLSVIASGETLTDAPTAVDDFLPLVSAMIGYIQDGSHQTAIMGLILQLSDYHQTMSTNNWDLDDLYLVVFNLRSEALNMEVQKIQTALLEPQVLATRKVTQSTGSGDESQSATAIPEHTTSTMIKNANSLKTFVQAFASVLGVDSVILDRLFDSLANQGFDIVSQFNANGSLEETEKLYQSRVETIHLVQRLATIPKLASLQSAPDYEQKVKQTMDIFDAFIEALLAEIESITEETIEIVLQVLDDFRALFSGVLRDIEKLIEAVIDKLKHPQSEALTLLRGSKHSSGRTQSLTEAILNLKSLPTIYIDDIQVMLSLFEVYELVSSEGINKGHLNSLSTILSDAVTYKSNRRVLGDTHNLLLTTLMRVDYEAQHSNNSNQTSKTDLDALIAKTMSIPVAQWSKLKALIAFDVKDSTSKHVALPSPSASLLAESLENLALASQLFSLLKTVGLNANLLLDCLELVQSRQKNRSNTSMIQVGAEIPKLLAQVAKKQAPTAYQSAYQSLLEMKRDALVPMVLNFYYHQTQKKLHDYSAFNLVDVDALSEYLMMDISVCGLAVDTPIVQGHATVQWYLRRVKEFVEVDKYNSSNNALTIKCNVSDTWWDWIQDFQVWVANRKIFLYPENYLSPELRPNQSEQFKHLVKTLSKGYLDDEAISGAFLTYVKEVMHLQGMLEDSKSARPINIESNTETIDLIGKVNSSPPEYFTAPLSNSGSVLGEIIKVMVDYSQNIYILHHLPVKNNQGTWAPYLFIRLFEYNSKAPNSSYQKYSDYCTGIIYEEDRYIIHFDPNPMDKPSSTHCLNIFDKNTFIVTGADSSPPETNKSAALSISYHSLKYSNKFKPVGQMKSLSSTANKYNTNITAQGLIDIVPGSFNGTGNGWMWRFTSSNPSQYNWVVFKDNSGLKQIKLGSIDSLENFIVSKNPSGTRNIGAWGDIEVIKPNDDHFLIYGVQYKVWSNGGNKALANNNGYSGTIYIDIIPTDHVIISPNNIVFIVGPVNPDEVPGKWSVQTFNPANNTYPQTNSANLQCEFSVTAPQDPTSFGFFKKIPVAISDPYNGVLPRNTHGKLFLYWLEEKHTNSMSSGANTISSSSTISINDESIYAVYCTYRDLDGTWRSPQKLGMSSDLPGTSGYSNYSGLVDRNSQPNVLIEDAPIDIYGHYSSEGSSETGLLTLTLNVQCPDNIKAFFSNVHSMLLNSSITSIYQANQSFVDLSLINDLWGQYYWELMFFAPLFIANRLSSLGQYEQAMKWYRVVYNPAYRTTPSNESSVTSATPFVFGPFTSTASVTNMQWPMLDSSSLDTFHQNPFNAHEIAVIHGNLPYMKYVVMQYMKNLIAWGDSLFTDDTRETVSQALSRYLSVSDLLGPTPKALYSATYPTERHTVSQLLHFMDWNEPSFSVSNLKSAIYPYNYNFSSYFRIPENTQFMSLWSEVSDRLFKIRHCLNIDGIRQQLALLSPPINPEALVAAVSARGGEFVQNMISDATGGTPSHYRFQVLLQRAKEYAAFVERMSDSLMSAMEREDAMTLRQMSEDYAQQAITAMTSIRQTAIDEANNRLSLLTAQGDSLQEQISFYTTQLQNNGVLPQESQAESTLATVAHMNSAQSAVSAAAQIAGAIPQVGSPFAMIYGGPGIMNGMMAAAGVLGVTSILKEHSANVLQRNAEHIRRSRQWQQQLTLLQSEVKQLSLRQAAVKLQLAVAKQELANQQASLAHQKAVATYNATRFTNLDLYTWHASQLYQLTQEAFSLAIKVSNVAVQAYQYELGKAPTSAFNNASFWSSSRKGILSGARLTQQLNALEDEYMTNNARRPEIEKVVSLRQCIQNKTPGFTLHTGSGDGASSSDNSSAGTNPTWTPATILNGTTTFSFSSDFFDADFELQNQERVIKFVSVTVPALTAPNQQINLVLSRTDHPSDPIYISRANSATGLFSVSLDSPRYLPFEGSSLDGSEWKLSASGKHDNTALYSTITDIQITFHYTTKAASSSPSP